MISVHGDPLGVLGTPDTGGQCLYIREISKELINLGFSKVDSYTRHWGNKPRIENFENLNNCRDIRIPCGPPEFVPKEQLKPYLPEFYKNLKEYISNKKITYDLVHSHYWDGGLVGTWIARDLKIPQIHTSHSLGAIKKATAGNNNINFKQRIDDEKIIFSQCSAIIAESTQEKRDLQKIYGVAEEKIHIIFAGVDTNWFYPRGSRETAKRELGFENEILILSLGRLDSRKGFDLLVRGIPEVISSLKSLSKKINVIISAGNKNVEGDLSLSKSEEKEYDKLMRLRSELDIEENFKLIPRIDYELVPLWYTAADVFVVPSRYETFGLVIVEAMACGTPVVATNVGGPPDIITDGHDGYTVNPQDITSYALRIRDVIKFPKTHQKMSNRAESTAIKKFSWSAITKQLVQLYSDLLKGKILH